MVQKNNNEKSTRAKKKIILEKELELPHERLPLR
jgi:hypothetical protein